MKAEFYLVLGARERRYGPVPRDFELHGTPRCTRKKPSTNAGEVAVKVAINLPDVLWRRPQISAQINVPDEGLSETTVTAEVLDSVAAELSKQLGVSVRVSAEDGE